MTTLKTFLTKTFQDVLNAHRIWNAGYGQTLQNLVQRTENIAQGCNIRMSNVKWQEYDKAVSIIQESTGPVSRRLPSPTQQAHRVAVLRSHQLATTPILVEVRRMTQAVLSEFDQQQTNIKNAAMAVFTEQHKRRLIAAAQEIHRAQEQHHTELLSHLEESLRQALKVDQISSDQTVGCHYPTCETSTKLDTIAFSRLFKQA